MQQQNGGNDRDRAERIAAAQRLLAQALASGVSARSMEESLLGGAITLTLPIACTAPPPPESTATGLLLQQLRNTPSS